MKARYRTLHHLGLAPWGTADLPDLATTPPGTPPDTPPDVAVDLGCGTGEHARALAARGWTVTAVDFIPAAIATARRRDPYGTVTWRRADVTSPAQVDPDGDLAGTARLILDVGCLHGLTPAGRVGWAATVATLAVPGAVLLVRAAPPASRGPGPRGIAAPTIDDLLTGAWSRLDQRGAWHWFTRVRVPAPSSPRRAVPGARPERAGVGPDGPTGTFQKDAGELGW